MFCEFWISKRYLKSPQKERIVSLTALISVIGIAIGVMVLIVVIAVMSGFDNYLQDKMVGTNAHLSLEFYGGSSEPYVLIDKLKTIPHVLAGAPFIAGQAFIKQGAHILGVEMRGIDPKLQPEVSKIKEYIKKGSLELADNGVILGEELALRLGLGLGDKITLISPVTLKPTEFIVQGLFNSGMYLYDAGLVMTNIKGAQDFFQLTNRTSGVAVKVDDLYRVDEMKSEIYQNLGNYGAYEIRTWVDANRNFLQALKLEKIVMFIVVTMTTVVAAFGIISTLIMSVMSKIRDIGILRAVGAKTKSILSIFIFQGLSLGISGIILGIILGVGLSSSLNRIIDFISGLIGRPLIPAEIYYFERIPTQINTADITLIVLCALGISLLASIYPAYYAAKINPNEAIRHE
ncbi:MAG: ABC transporter permease [Candidatus Omnitrophica bacterium]|nr:ABC transporter permease [Candidatus Omnitrophota bacterium]MBI5144893.1 ABC transporter permease [Candidatus Omnitrophota bacterium]